MLFKLNVVKQGRSARMKTRIMTSGGQNQSLTKLQGRERLAANRGHPMTSSSTWVSLMVSFSFFHSGATKKIRTVQKTKVEKCWAIWAAHCTHWTGTDLKLEPKMGPKTVIQRAQNTHSASEFCSHWRTYYQFWCANLVLFKNNQVCVPKHPISSSTKHTPFLSLFSLVLHWLLFSPTMTNRWLSLKAYHDKNQALKHECSPQVLWVKVSSGTTAAWRTYTATRDDTSRWPQTHLSPFTATCTELWQVTSAAIGSDLPAAHRKGTANWEEPLRAMSKTILFLRLAFTANQLKLLAALQVNQMWLNSLRN